MTDIVIVGLCALCMWPVVFVFGLAFAYSLPIILDEPTCQRLRQRFRPLLWRLNLDWGENQPVTHQVITDRLEQGLPVLPQELSSSPEGGELDDWQMVSGPSTSMQPNTSPSVSDSSSAR